VTAYEYDQLTCDAWQMADLAQSENWQGWEVVTAVPTPSTPKVFAVAGDETSEVVDATEPVTLLFRRPVDLGPDGRGAGR
jgi:hypothetical protein